jgi:hypothetical protein
VRIVVSMLVAGFATGLVGVAFDLSAHGPASLYIGVPLWLLFYWVPGHKAWLLARGNPERRDA